MPSLRIELAVALFFYSLASANAGTVITGLPNGSAIINIDSRADGAASYSGANFDAAYQPFNLNNSLLEYTFQPGTYFFRVIDQTDAAALFPSLTLSELNQIGGAWTYNSPWATDYLAFDSSAATDANQHQLFTGAVTDNGFGYSTPAAAYQQAKTVGYFNQIVTGSGRYTGTTAASYTFGATQTLIFTVYDYYLPDNSGIVSVLISQPGTAVPEPSAVALGVLGLLSLGLNAWRRRRRA